MRFLFLLSVLFSGVVSIVGFTFTNMTTPAFDPAGDNFVGGNGNPGLLFVMFPLVIILYFFFAMMFVFEKLHSCFLAKVGRFKVCYFVGSMLIFGISAIRIVLFRNKINPFFDYEIGYLNPFSNHLFFNFWTFVAILCVSAYCSFYLKKKV